MKIAIVAHNLIRGDGQGRINLELAKYLHARGHQITCVSETMADELRVTGITWSKISPAVKRPNLLNGMLFVRLADHWLDNHSAEFDVVVGNGHTLTKCHHVNLCQFVHGAWIRSRVHPSRLAKGPKSWYQYLYTRYNAQAERRSYSNARFVVAPSNLIRDELLSIGVPEDKIRVIYNGVDLDEFQPGDVDRHALGLPSESPLALFVGDICSRRKNLDTTLHAVAKVPNVRLAIAGKVKGSPYPALARQLGIESRVHFLNFRKDVGTIMRAVDMFVFPSRYDTFGLVVLEAMASGLPVVTAASVGASELMTPETGIVLGDAENADALADAIRVYSDPMRRSAAGAAARIAAKAHGWETMSAQYLSLFEESLQ